MIFLKNNTKTKKSLYEHSSEVLFGQLSLRELIRIKKNPNFTRKEMHLLISS